MSQALDIKVIRAWAFTHGSPASAGHGSNRLTYSPQEMAGLDYLVQQVRGVVCNSRDMRDATADTYMLCVRM
jgi:hypothetical protein